MKSFVTPRALSTPVSRYSSRQTASKGNKNEAVMDALSRPYRMYEQYRQSRDIDIYISDEIGDPLDYTDMIQQIRTAGPSDTVYIHLNTPGGRLDTGIQIINALRSTEAHVVTELEGVGHSMGALMFLCGKEIVVHENTQLMFHNYSGGMIGKGNEMRGQSEATDHWFRVMAHDICYPFLSRREITRMLKGEDFWFQYPQIQQRITRMVEILQKEAAEKAALAEVQADLDAAIQEALDEEVVEVLVSPEKTGPVDPEEFAATYGVTLEEVGLDESYGS